MDTFNLPEKMYGTMIAPLEEMEDMNTFLLMKDYDWMHHHLYAEFPINDEGVPQVVVLDFEYIGADYCFMAVCVRGLRDAFASRTCKEGIVRYKFPTEIFNAHIRAFLSAQSDSFGSDKAFRGDDIVFDFYNDVMEHHLDSECGDVDPICLPDYL